MKEERGPSVTAVIQVISSMKDRGAQRPSSTPLSAVPSYRPIQSSTVSVVARPGLALGNGVAAFGSRSKCHTAGSGTAAT